MKNLNVRGKFIAIVLASSMAFTLSGCDDGDFYSRKVISQNNIDEQAAVSFNYDNGNENIDYTRTSVKTFEPGEHQLLIKVAGTIGYDSAIQVEPIDGYEITDVTYGENATGKYGNEYGYLTFLYKNSEPVEAVGYYDTEKGDYAFTSFGKVIEQEKTNIK